MPGSNDGQTPTDDPPENMLEEGTPPAGEQEKPGEPKPGESPQGEGQSPAGDQPQGESGESSGNQPEGAGSESAASESSGGDSPGADGEGKSEESSGGGNAPSSGPGGPKAPNEKPTPGGDAGESGGESTQSGQGGGNQAASDAPGNSPKGGEPGNESGDGAAGDGGEGTADNIKGDDPDLENKRKAANLVLKQLEDQIQRGDVDPEMLEKLGVSEDRLKDFTRKLRERLADTGEDTSPDAKARRLQFQETLRNLDFNSTGTSREGGERPRESASGFGGQRQQAPARYRDAAEAYRKLINKRKASDK